MTSDIMGNQNYTGWPKIGTFVYAPYMPITSSDIDQFSNFFHCQKPRIRKKL